MSLKDWINSPLEWGDWGARLDAWMKPLRDLVEYISVGFSENGGFRQFTSHYIDTSVLSVDNEIQIGDGSAADPSITFIADGDTGFYRSSSGSVSMTSNGVRKMIMTDDSIRHLAVDSTGPTITNPPFEPQSNISGVPDPRVYKDSDGFVNLFGYIHVNTATGFPSNLFVLPAGYRPAIATNAFGVVWDRSPDGFHPARLSIETNGQVNYNGRITLAPNDKVFLNGARFYVGW